MNRILFLTMLCMHILGLVFVHGLEKDPIRLYEVDFSDHKSLITQFISLINQEKKSIELAAYCLRHNGVAKALLAAQKRGVFVEVVVDPFSVRSRSPIKKMAESKMPVFIWSPTSPEVKTKVKKNLMHDTFCIFGAKKVWTGSVDFSQDSRTQFCDTALVLEQETLALAFHKEFEKLKTKCISYFEFEARMK